MILLIAFQQYCSLYAQEEANNSYPPVKRINISQLTDNLNLYQKNDILSPMSNHESNNTRILFDSLKADADNHSLTRTLYNLLVVSENPGFYKSVNASSNKEYEQYEDQLIRNIVIYTMGPYGLNLSDIDIDNIYRSNNMLNRTHVNTREKKIRNQLFFSEGDKIDGVIISDNERAIRALPYIYDCRMVVVPVSGGDVDIVVLTKDVYSLGLSTRTLNSYYQGTASLYEKNVLGLGHELSIKIPYDIRDLNSVHIGKGISYNIYNLFKSFINFRVSILDSMDTDKFGIYINRGFYSSSTKYAGGISLSRIQIKEEIDITDESELGKFDNRDLWLARSFLVDEEPATRIILGIRYIYNDAKRRPEIEAQSYQYYHNYQSILGSITFSSQRYYKNNLIYGYGRTEDIPYGGMIAFTGGREYGEFKQRSYWGTNISFGTPLLSLGYIHSSLGLSSYNYEGVSEQGVFIVDMNYISNLIYIGSYRMRNFLRVDYLNGFNRYLDESVILGNDNGFTGFGNDSISGTNRLTLSAESVIFGPRIRLGFRSAYFIFGDLGYLFDSGESINNGDFLSSIGIGIRLRNDNLVINTVSVRLAFYPSFPINSSLRNLMVSGEQLLRPKTFEPIPPSVIPYYDR